MQFVRVIGQVQDAGFNVELGHLVALQLGTRQTVVGPDLQDVGAGHGHRLRRLDRLPALLAVRHLHLEVLQELEEGVVGRRLVGTGILARRHGVVDYLVGPGDLGDVTGCL